MHIDAVLVRRLVATQFPQWSDLAVRPVTPGGWDNRSFRLGEHLLVRLPSTPDCAAQVHKEQQWLPQLGPLLPLPIPQPLALGAPAEGYALPWSIDSTGGPLPGAHNFRRGGSLALYDAQTRAAQVSASWHVLEETMRDAPRA